MARPPVSTATGRPPAPLQTQTSGSLAQHVRLLTDAVNRKADITVQPTFAAVLLMAPSGGIWRVTVDDAGVISTELVPV
jgi:hypothetical protein